MIIHKPDDGDESDENGCSIPRESENDKHSNRHWTRSHANQGKSVKNSKVSNVDNEVLCYMCTMVFSTEEILVKHILRDHPDVKYKCKVHGCQYLFGTRRGFTNHIKKHSGVTLQNCQLLHVKFIPLNRKSKSMEQTMMFHSALIDVISVKNTENIVVIYKNI